MVIWVLTIFKMKRGNKCKTISDFRQSGLVGNFVYIYIGLEPVPYHNARNSQETNHSVKSHSAVFNLVSVDMYTIVYHFMFF